VDNANRRLEVVTISVWWDRCMQFRVIMVIDPQTNKQTQPQTLDRTDYNTLRRS